MSNITSAPTSVPQIRPRTGLDSESIKKEFQNHLRFDLAVNQHSASHTDKYLALAWTVRDRVVDRWMKTQEAYYEQKAKRVYYLSMEFLIGRSLGRNVISLEMEKAVQEAMSDLGLSWEELRDEEVDAGLGNGGLGRLAACFLESMATLGIPAIGYSLRYQHGIFQQEIRNGYQVEQPDNWLREGNPWEIARPHMHVPVHFGGHVEMHQSSGQFVVNWVPQETVWGMPYDIPAIGFGGLTVNTLRLWHAASPNDFDLYEFNSGDYLGAVDSKVAAENLTKVLYPSDATSAGKELRFRQQYFFVACSLHDIIRRFMKTSNDWNELPNLVAIQLNDTHPTLAIPELMRILLDIYGLTWDQAWEISRNSIAYTNHTLLSEALETWPAEMVQRLLPRHYQIICEINHRLLKKVAARFPGNDERRERMSIFTEGANRMVRMAHLAVTGSHSVNGVAALHTDLLKQDVLSDFAAMYPEKFNNKTNGVTPRRFLLKANPPLAQLITDTIGSDWVLDLNELKKLVPLAEQEDFRAAFRQSKHDAKMKLIEDMKKQYGIIMNPHSIFDVQCKRIHTYKRQLLNVLHIILLYDKMHAGELNDFVPTTFIFSGKAAPAFHLAKMVIKLINNVAEIINNDPLVNERLNVFFLPNYRVSLAERMIPAADVSEQISVAGTEASGTGNMKFMMNGALTLGTMDGANVEIVEEVGIENAFIFGLNAEQVIETRGYYNPWWHYENDENVRRAIDLLFKRRAFNPDEPGIFEPIRQFLFEQGDPYMHLADFESYAHAQQHVQQGYRNEQKWSRKAVLNIACSGKFSSDRTVMEYAKDIWKAKQITVPENDD